jgi:hypothetical protein
MAKTSPVLEKDPNTGRFLPGNSGFGGRPKGSRNTLNEMFLRDLQEAWEEKGKAVIKAAMATKPEAVLKVMAALLPKQVEPAS